MTATERLLLLLPLANRDPLTTAELRSRVSDFLDGFEARGLRLSGGEDHMRNVHHATPAELKAVAEGVAHVFFVGLLFEGPPWKGMEDTGPDDMGMPLEFPSLKFGAFKPKVRKRARFDWMVEADSLHDLVAYLVMYILATEETRFARCHAPALRNWKNKCHRILIGGGLGRTRLTCNDACAARVKAKKVNDQARRERKAWQAAHPKRSIRNRAKR
jgi:hypothetical protein